MNLENNKLPSLDRKNLKAEFPHGVHILNTKGLYGINTEVQTFSEPERRTWMNLEKGHVTFLKIGEERYIFGYLTMDGHTPQQASRNVLSLLEKWYNIIQTDTSKDLFGGIMAIDPVMTTINSEAGRRVLSYLGDLYPGRVVVPERVIVEPVPVSVRKVVFSIGRLEVSKTIKRG